MEKETLGQLVSRKMSESGKSAENMYYVPTEVLKELRSDMFWPNSIPIMLFMIMLDDLSIPFKEVEPAVANTFAILSERNIHRDSYNALWENEESINKYMSRLKVLMHEKED